MGARRGGGGEVNCPEKDSCKHPCGLIAVLVTYLPKDLKYATYNHKDLIQGCYPLDGEQNNLLKFDGHASYGG
ncbi:unnamed protein product [Acanthoscelides obtectus]|uniref:Uncharacterized protein n=1 Tax=Acanthoscelides obtectus TaxID=200917 RepID=A0A9P0KQ94_ACAOB|nr:unnamed protein product [Acanthoscelides obtectus]CAK1650018.1 hypothetical protein AOBTE_LOCUS16544 [Acanthoscelides obtectus]